MKRLFEKLALLALLGTSTSLFAEQFTYYSDPCCQDQDYYVEIEALYWKTMHCPIFVARRFNGGGATLTGIPRPREEFYLTGEYDPGVRVRAGIQRCNWFADLSYLYFFSDENISADRGDFTSMIMAGSPSFENAPVLSASGSDQFRYQNVDGRFGHNFCHADCLSTFLYANVRWVKIDFKNTTTGVPADNDEFPTFEDRFRQDTSFYGGGFGLGAGTSYTICGGLSLRGNVGVMAIIGESKVKNFSSIYIEGETGDIRNNFLSKSQSWCHILPALDFKLGLNYGFCFCSCPIGVEVGYELNYYRNVMRFASDTEVGFGRAEIPYFACQNLGFAGPYFKLAVCF